jgi:hypothetical protein
MLIGGTETIHHHIVQKILPIILKGLPRQCFDLSIRPPSLAHPFNILQDIGSRLFHQKVEKVSHDNAEKSLYRPRDEGRTELKKEKVNESIEGFGVAFLHLNPRIVLSGNERPSECPNDDF